MIDIKTIRSILKKKGGFELSQILFKKNSTFKLDIPDKIKKDYGPINKKWVEKDRNNSFKNQDSLCISKFQVKDQKLFLEFCEDKYITRQSISEVLGSMNLIDQDVMVSEINNQSVRLPISYKINVGIITKDNKLIFTKRSSKVATNKSKLDFGISKGVKPEDFNGKMFQPLITSIRALKEELNLELDIKEVIKKEAFEVKEFYLNREIFSLGFLCILDLRKIESKNLTFKEIKNITENAKNNWEISDLFSVDYNKKSLLLFMKKEFEKITNYSNYHLIQLIEKID